MRIARPERHRLISGAVATVLVASGIVAGAALPASATDFGHHDRTTYVALGDSYAAGQGGGPWLDPCHHTDGGYTDVLDARRGIDLVREPSCAAATTVDVLARQIRALNRRVELVTVTIGGNDANFLGVAGACLPAPESAECGVQLATATRILTTPGLFHSLRKTFARIAAAAPRARIVVTGYPMLFSGAAAAGGLGKTFNDSTVILNATIAAAAYSVKAHNRADIAYVGAFSGHGVGSADPWIVGVEDPANALHPNVLGYKAYAKLIARAIR